jgi:basic amino acid/polyamine antiporter, APA family
MSIPSAAGPEAGREDFVRGLGLFDAAAIVAGSMIGSGIFIVSQDIASSVGSGGWLLVVWALSGLMTVACALSYGELAAMFPQAGGQYVYLREAYGPLPGFLYGWTLFLVIQSGSIAAVGVAFGKYLSVVVEATTGSGYGPGTVKAVGIVTIALLTALNTTGLRAGKLVQNAFTSVKALTLVVLVVLGLLYADRGAALFSGGLFEARSIAFPSGATAPLGGLALLLAAGAAMVGSLFSSDAWNNATFVAGEVRDPQRSVGAALLLGTGVVIVLYLLVNVAYLATLPIERIATAPEQRVAAEMMGTLFGTPGRVALSAAVLVSAFGCNNGLILSGARLVWAMAQDGLFFRAAGELGAKSRVPVKALVIQAIWSSLLVLSGSYSEILDYVIFAALLFYILTLAGIFVLRRTRPDAPRPYRAWGYPVVPVLYILLALVIMVVLVVCKPAYTVRGLAIVAAGVPVFYLWRRRSRARA